MALITRFPSSTYEFSLLSVYRLHSSLYCPASTTCRFQLLASSESPSNSSDQSNDQPCPGSYWVSFSAEDVSMSGVSSVMQDRLSVDRIKVMLRSVGLSLMTDLF